MVGCVSGRGGVGLGEGRGEIAQALASGAIADGKAVELGAVLSGEAGGRTSDDQVTVFDSTGVAVQNIAIATAVVDAALDQESVG